MLTMEEYLKDHYLPKTREITVKWAKFFYEFEPMAANLVDTQLTAYGHPITDDKLVEILQPHFKMLIYKDYERRIAFEKMNQ